VGMSGQQDQNDSLHEKEKEEFLGFAHEI
jgi:hypothetical protein